MQQEYSMTTGRTFKNWALCALMTPFVFAACADSGAYAEEGEDQPESAAAMAAAPTAVTSSLMGLHGMTQQSIVATAEMLSDEVYGFQPTEDVRTAGQVLAHIANSQYFFCSTAAGETSPMTDNLEETLEAKADIVAALGESFTYCASVYENMDDVAGAETVSLMGNDMAKSAILAFNSAHNYEHYGNLVTYMRLNGITPPSSM
jgi:uncharacterized damage-inducible protein DinB